MKPLPPPVLVKRLPPEKNLDGTKPIVHQPPLGTASVQVSPDSLSPGRQEGGAGENTNNNNNQDQTCDNKPSPCSKSQPQPESDKTSPDPQLTNPNKPDTPHCKNCNNCNSHPTKVETPHDKINYSLDATVIGHPDLDSDPQEEEVPPYYRKRVPGPLPPGHFRDERSQQVFVREAYHPEGLTPCEVRTYQVIIPPEPDTPTIKTFHPGRITPVNNFSDFENHERARRKDSGESGQSCKPHSGSACCHPSVATCPHECKLSEGKEETRGEKGGEESETMAAVASVPNGVARLQERNDLADLNDRLAHYVTEVKHLREQTNRVDSTAFLESIKILEDGIYNLKTLYEQELEKAR